MLNILLKQGVSAWNQWRLQHPQENLDFPRVDLRGVDIRNADLGGAKFYRSDFSNADLRGAHLSGAFLYRAKLNGTKLNSCNMVNAVLHFGELKDADLPWADLTGADLGRCNLTGADLYGANLEFASMVEANVADARLTDCRVYGVSAWGLKGIPHDASNLIVTPQWQPAVTVDDLEVAQFIYLLLHNQKVKNVIDTITSKVVLILGRFTEERKEILDALRDELRIRNLSPILFDFDVPQDRDITETVTLLARMARFVIADLTDPKSIPHEIQAIAPDVSVPIQPIIVAGQEPWSMFKDLRRKYHWVLEPYEYTDQQHLLETLSDVIAPAEAKREELSA